MPNSKANKAGAAVKRRAASKAATPGPKRRVAEMVDAAAAVFAEKSYHGATTQDIADRLGIRQASLYYYFASKDEALEQVCMLGVEGFLETAAAIAKENVSAGERVRAIIRSHLLPMQERKNYVTVFLNERQHLPTAVRRRINRLAGAYEKVIENILREGVATGQLAAGTDVRMATLAILGMCNWAPRWFGAEPEASIDRVTEAFAALALQGLAPGRTPRPR